MGAFMINVLYIEDEPINIRLVQKMLSFSGYDVSKAETGEAGIQKAIEELPDIILLDINLPDMNGFDVAHILKSQPETADIPIIALTALSLFRNREYAGDQDCDDYLPKPTSRSELLIKIQKYVGYQPMSSAANTDPLAPSS